MRWFDQDFSRVRGLLTQAMDIIDEVAHTFNDLANMQEEKLDNMPESLESTLRYQMMEERMDTFEECTGICDRLADLIPEIIDEMDTLENIPNKGEGHD